MSSPLLTSEPLAQDDSTSRLRDPSKLFYQRDITRRYIILAYWCTIILALPLWWSTTSIERLSLPSTRVVSQARNHLRIPVRLSIETEHNGRILAVKLQELIDRLIFRTPDRWKGLDIEINQRQSKGMSLSKYRKNYQVNLVQHRRGGYRGNV